MVQRWFATVNLAYVLDSPLLAVLIMKVIACGGHLMGGGASSVGSLIPVEHLIRPTQTEQNMSVIQLRVQSTLLNWTQGSFTRVVLAIMPLRGVVLRAGMQDGG